MQAIDTHCHVSHTIKKGLPLEKMLKHCQEEKVIAFIDSPVYLDEYKQAIKNHQEHPKEIFVTLGIPPARYHELPIEEYLELMRKYAKTEDIVGIGEVGLDYYWVKKEPLRQKQHEIFQQFIELANGLKLPITIHSRDAEAKAVEILEENARTTVVMHSFAGTVETAQKCVENQFYISIPTAVTNRKKHRRVARTVPLELLVVETDSPYLSPLKNRRLNEPANVTYAVKEIAKLKDLSEEEVYEQTTKNAIEIFKLPI
ncbi:TatD family deoxyribonuclease [Candidatus Heimdallarchaeota archaeon]|nr:MAG: TatD family deoxyribonuclease [Candidatus Heimdallarchaeota archaeon]